MDKRGRLLHFLSNKRKFLELLKPRNSFLTRLLRIFVPPYLHFHLAFNKRIAFGLSMASTRYFFLDRCFSFGIIMGVWGVEATGAVAPRTFGHREPSPLFPSFPLLPWADEGQRKNRHLRLRPFRRNSSLPSLEASPEVFNLWVLNVSR